MNCGCEFDDHGNNYAEPKPPKGIMPGITQEQIQFPWKKHDDYNSLSQEKEAHKN